MPNVSSLPTNISWNVHKSKNIEALIESTFAYLANDGHLLLFVHEKKEVQDDVRTFAAFYDFVF